MPRGRNGVYRRMGEPNAPHGLLGQHGRPVHHIRQQVYRDVVVSVEAALRQGSALQGLHHTALLAGRRHGSVDPRAEPARLLPRRQGYDLHRAVPHRAQRAQRGAVRRRRGRALLPRMDHYPVDAAVEYGAGRGTRHRVCTRQVPQPLHRRAADRHNGLGARADTLYQEDGGHIHRRRQDMARPRAGGCGVRAADRLDQARRRCVPRHRRRLRFGGRRYGYSPHRADIRCRRRPRGTSGGHRSALRGRQGRQEPAHGRPPRPLLPDRGSRREVRPDQCRRRALRRVCRTLRQERIRRDAG